MAAWTLIVALCSSVWGATPTLKEDYQVLQRDAKDQASCVVALPPGATARGTYRVEVRDAAGKLVSSSDVASKTFDNGVTGVGIEGLCTGGPYTITATAKDAAGQSPLVFRHILVGDIWILGGQSNMFGIDMIREELPALDYLNMLNPVHIQLEAHWCAGLPPIHRIPDQFAPFTLKSQHPEYTPEQIQKIIADKTPVGGIDASYFFARSLYAATKVPIGLIPCAMGGALAIWDPQERAKNRYGFLHHHVSSAGGKVKGVLFFQGEQDAIFGDENQTVTKPSLIYPITTYGEQFRTFVEALRRDFENPEMPVILAQICRHHHGEKGGNRGWELIREQQRLIPLKLSHSHTLATIDLDVMDGLHLDYASLKRVGERMARLAVPYVATNAAPRSEIKLESVRMGTTLTPTIVVEFSGVSGRLRAPGRPTGFCLKKRETGETLDWIYKVDFDPEKPNVALLRVTLPQREGVVLYYGAGAAPYVNLVDESDMAVPAFGPIALE